MKTLSLVVVFLGGVILVATFLAAQGQGPRRVAILVPASTRGLSEDIGLRAHTNHLVLQLSQTSATNPAGESPQHIYAVYGLAFTGAGGGGTIAVVDAYDYPTADQDLRVFSRRFGLPECSIANGCFQVVYATGQKPLPNCYWSEEAALDIEWAHAMAPDARIVLVEAKSNTYADLFRAVNVASHIINPANAPVGTGLGQVSMSWGGGEFPSETNYDLHFYAPGVVYFAASGDTGGLTEYPCVSSRVVCVGGTTVYRDTGGRFLSETAWSDSGGGPSAYETKPTYQTNAPHLFSLTRAAPDVSFDADPYSGVAVYDSTSCNGMSGWLVLGGTSVGAPSMAGIVNAAGSKYNNGPNELATIYSSLGTSSYRDITAGQAGFFHAEAGWDFATGVGSSVGLAGK